MSKPHPQSRIHLVRKPTAATPNPSEPPILTFQRFVQVPFDFDSLHARRSKNYCTQRLSMSAIPMCCMKVKLFRLEAKF